MKKIEIIEIPIKIDVEEEIRKVTDDLSTIENKATSILERAKLRQQPILTKKQKERLIWRTRLDDIFNVLKEFSSIENPYRTLNFVLEKAKVELTKSENIGINKRIHNYLSTIQNNKWALLTRRSKGQTLYALAKFGE